MAIALMFKGGLNLMTKPQLFFKGDRFRIFGTFSYKNTIENFYGIGYSTNKDYERGEDTSEYRYSGIQVNPWFLFRLGESNIFAGPQVDLNYDKITKPAAGMVNEPSYIAMIFWRMNILIYGLGLIKDWYVLIRKVEM